MAQTKKITNLVTKSDLKEAVKGLATKKDVAKVAIDVAGLKKDVVGLKTDVSGLKTDVAGLATKADIAEVMWELKEIREENVVLADMKRQVNDHEDRIEIVEEKLKIPSLAA